MIFRWPSTQPKCWRIGTRATFQSGSGPAFPTPPGADFRQSSVSAGDKSLLVFVQHYSSRVAFDSWSPGNSKVRIVYQSGRQLGTFSPRGTSISMKGQSLVLYALDCSSPSVAKNLTPCSLSMAQKPAPRTWPPSCFWTNRDTWDFAASSQVFGPLVPSYTWRKGSRVEARSHFSAWSRLIGERRHWQG